MSLPNFELEEYLSIREFRTKYMFCASDPESMTMYDLLELADQECKDLWKNLKLSYTEPQGHPLLIAELREWYGLDSRDSFLMFAGAEEGIYCAMRALLEPSDHVIAISPGYQSLYSLPQTFCQCDVLQLEEKNNWRLDIEALEGLVNKNTKMLVINYPHNPSGALLTADEQSQIIEIARKHNLYIFSDEVYRLLELDVSERLPAMANAYEKGISLSVMSKAFGFAGLRIGWVASQDMNAIKSMTDYKHYLSIMNSAPSEILTLVALRNREQILERNREILNSNIILLDEFFSEYSDIISWVRPKGGCVGFPSLRKDILVDQFAEELLAEEDVLVLPASVYQLDCNNFRLSFGRKNTSQALERMKSFINKHYLS